MFTDSLFWLAALSPVLGLVGLIFMALTVRFVARTQMRVRPMRVVLLFVAYFTAAIVLAVPLAVLMMMAMPATGGPGQAGGLLLVALIAAIGVSLVLVGVICFVVAKRDKLPSWLS